MYHLIYVMYNRFHYKFQSLYIIIYLQSDYSSCIIKPFNQKLTLIVDIYAKLCSMTTTFQGLHMATTVWLNKVK